MISYTWLGQFTGASGTWDDASVTVNGRAASGEPVTFHGTPDVLNLSGANPTDPTPISGDAWSHAGHDLNASNAQVQDFASPNLSFASTVQASDAFGSTNSYDHLDIRICCFAAGTRILTPRGEVAVEELRAGDLVTTFAGRGEADKPIKWIGQRVLDLDNHPVPQAARPIRIRRGAFAPAVPHRDLLVSPDHAIFAEGVLIPAKCLVNGVTVLQDDRCAKVHYFHLELDAHDVVMSEGLRTETYLDTGNRDMFEGDWEMVLHPMFEVGGSSGLLAPMVVNDAPVPVRVAEQQAA